MSAFTATTLSGKLREIADYFGQWIGDPSDKEYEDVLREASAALGAWKHPRPWRVSRQSDYGAPEWTNVVIQDATGHWVMRVSTRSWKDNDREGSAKDERLAQEIVDAVNAHG